MNLNHQGITSRIVIWRNGRRGLEMNREFNCKLCGETFDGIGHFLSQGGYCCDGCNWTKVLPARLKGEHL